MAEFTVKTPDGAVYKVQGPDNATEEQAIALVREKLATLEPGNSYDRFSYQDERPAAPAQEPWTNDADRNLLTSAANTVAGLVEGAGAIVDLPAQALGWALGEGADLLGLPDWVGSNLRNPVTVGGAVEDLIPRPTRTGPSLVRAASAGLGGVGTGLGTSRALVQASSPVTRSVGELLGVAPGQQAGAGITAGLATEGARQLGAPVPVQLAAGLTVGGLTPTGLKGVAAGTDALVDRLTDEGAMREAASFIRGNMARPEHEILRDLDLAGPSVSAARPTLAEVTLDPGLAAMQRGVANISGPTGARISTRLGDNAQRRMDAVDDALGRGDPAAIEQAARTQERTIGRNLQTAVERVGPVVAPDEAGAAARARIAEGHQAARARTSDAYGNPVLADDEPIRLRPYDAAELTVPTRGDTRKLESFQDEAVRGYRSAVPPRPRSLLEWVRAKGGVASDSMGADDLRSAGMDAKGQPTLVRQNGVDLDRLREGAVEAGYIGDDVDLSEFTALLQAEYAGGKRIFAIGDDMDLAAHNEGLQARNFWRQQFDSRDLDPSRMTNEDWVRFYNDVEVRGSDSARTLDDMRSEPGPGSLMGPFQQTIFSLRQRFFGDGGKEAPAVVRNFFSDILEADEVGIKTLEGWERKALDLARDAPDRTTAASLQAVARAIGAKASTASGPERRAALEAARGARRQQAQDFEEGAVGRVTQRGDYGRPALPDSEVGRVLVPRGRQGGEAADQLSRAAGSDAETIVRTEMRRALDAAGDDPRRIALVAREYQEATSRFPGVAADIRNARQNAALSSRFRRTQLGQFLNENMDPAQAVGRLLTVKDGGRSFQMLVGGPGMTPQALGGIRRGIAEHVRSISRSANVDANLQNIPNERRIGEGIATALERTAGTQVLNKTQRATLNAVRRELRASQFARSANRPSGSDTARNLGMGFALVEKAMNLAPGSGATKSVLQFVFQNIARTDDILAVVGRAVEDPKFAAELLRRPTADRVRRVVEGVQVYNSAALMGAAAASE